MNIYSCRKFVGTPDGAYVIGKDAHKYVEKYPQCYSSDTATFFVNAHRVWLRRERTYEELVL